MKSNKTQELIESYIEKHGEEELQTYLESKLQEDFTTLTIIGNAGTHVIPPEHLHGQVYEVTTGNLDLSSKETIVTEYSFALSKLLDKLKERSWKKVYFVPTGHTSLVLQIKLLVYHVLRISTIDLFYNKGDYIELDLDYRQLLSNESS